MEKSSVQILEQKRFFNMSILRNHPRPIHQATIGLPSCCFGVSGSKHSNSARRRNYQLLAFAAGIFAISYRKVAVDIVL